MTSEELIDLRRRLGMSRQRLATELGMSASRLADYEIGFTRGRNTPAPIPRSIELALTVIAQRAAE